MQVKAWLLSQKYPVNFCCLLCITFNCRSASHKKGSPCEPLPSPLKVRPPLAVGVCNHSPQASQEQLLLPLFVFSSARGVFKRKPLFWIFSFIRAFLAVSLPSWCCSTFRHSWNEVPNSQSLWLGTEEEVSLATATPERSQSSTSTCLRFLFNLGVCTLALHGELGSVFRLYS